MHSNTSSNQSTARACHNYARMSQLHAENRQRLTSYLAWRRRRRWTKVWPGRRTTLGRRRPAVDIACHTGRVNRSWHHYHRSESTTTSCARHRQSTVSLYCALTYCQHPLPPDTYACGHSHYHVITLDHLPQSYFVSLITRHITRVFPTIMTQQAIGKQYAGRWWWIGEPSFTDFRITCIRQHSSAKSAADATAVAQHHSSSLIYLL